MSNTVFTMSPPDVRLSINGPSILFMGISDTSKQELTSMIDRQFCDIEVSYYAGSSLTEATAAWYYTAAGIANYIIADPSNISAAEVLIILENKATTTVFFVGTVQGPICQLLNSYGYRIFADLKSLSKAEFED
jgi:hypothetical protein